METAVSSELELPEPTDSAVVQDLIRSELQKILLERQDVLERLALGASAVSREPAVDFGPFMRRASDFESTAPEVSLSVEPQAFDEFEVQASAPPEGDQDESQGEPTLDADERLQLMQSEIERYKRRISKLCGSLERAESALQMYADGGLDPVGIPSVFRTVQGLSRDDGNYKMKQAALSQIFEANVALRQDLTTVA